MSDSYEAADDWQTADEAYAPEDWPFRPLLLAVIGLAAGVAAHLIAGDRFLWSPGPPPALTLAELAAITVGAGMFGFTLERRHWWASLLFALVAAGIAAGVVYWNGSPSAWSGGDGWRTVSLFLALAIAAPLFQALRDYDWGGISYASVHDYAWTNVVQWCACWVFVGIVYALLFLLSALFHIVRIDFLQDLLREQYFTWPLTGAAFGAGLGLLREHDNVVRLLHRVVATVLAVLAPVLGLGLLAFLLVLPFTGLTPLWDARVPTTPLLLTCVIGALVLANAVIGNAPAQESRLAPLRWGAMLLAVVMLPLAVLGGIATGMRIGQYGFTPERLWAVTFVVIAIAYGLAYLVAVARGWMRWAEHVRPANLVLAVGLFFVALLLATPLISFNAISTRDQVSRLESGKVAPDRFDWAALAFDFGQPGRDALARLQASKDAAIAKRASEVAKSDNRWDVQVIDEQAERREKLGAEMRVLPQGAALPVELRDLIVAERGYRCTGGGHCTLFLVEGGREALLLDDACFAPPAEAKTPAETRAVMVPGACTAADRYALRDGKWAEAGDNDARTPEQAAATRSGYTQGKLEVRTIPRRQLFVDGVPVGAPFE